MPGLDGSIYSSVTGPAPNKLMAQANPMEQLGQVVGVAQGIQNLTSTQFDLAHRQLSAVNGLMSSIAQDPSDSTISQAAIAARQMGIPADKIAAEIGTLSGMGPQDRVKYAVGHISRNMSALDQIMAATGRPTPVNTGDRTVFQSVNPITNTVAPMGGAGASIPNEVGPEGRMTPDTGINPVTKEPVAIPRGSRFDVRGNPLPQPRMTPATGLPAGAMTTGQAPGEAETQRAGAESGVQLRVAAEESPTRKGMLAQLETDLDHFTSGPGADWQNVAKAWANRNVLPSSMQFDPKSIASQEAFQKQATQLATQQFKAIGGTGTDDKFSAAFKSNPNTALSQMGNRGMIQLLKGNEDAVTAKNEAWQRWKERNGAGSYDQFTTAFNRVYNPLVFQAQYMNPDEVRNLRTKLSDNDRKKFEQSYIIAKQNGWLGGNSGSP